MLKVLDFVLFFENFILNLLLFNFMVINRVFFICYDYIFFIYNNWNSLLEFNRDREKKINVMNNKLYF